jgi:hypothetical protein
VRAMTKRKSQQEIIPVKVTVFNKEDKLELLAANESKIAYLGDYYYITAEEAESQAQFKGIVNMPDLKNWNLELFKKRLSAGVQKVHPNFDVEKDLDIFKRKDWITGMVKPTGIFSIVFKDNQPVSEIEICEEMYPVKPYEPEPRRCYQCGQFGHSKRFCPNEERCFDCNQALHGNTKCTVSRSCANCTGTDHNTISKDCPVRSFMAAVEQYCRKYDMSSDEILQPK